MNAEDWSFIGTLAGAFFASAYSAYQSYQAKKSVKNNGYERYEKMLKEEQACRKNEIEKLRRGQLETAKRIIHIEKAVSLLVEKQGLKVDYKDDYDEIQKMLGD